MASQYRDVMVERESGRGSLSCRTLPLDDRAIKT